MVYIIYPGTLYIVTYHFIFALYIGISGAITTYR